MRIELTDEEFNDLLVMCGYALGAAVMRDEPKLARRFLVLGNQINQHNPRWTPYEIPEESQIDAFYMPKMRDDEPPPGR